MLHSRNTIAIPPGETIREQLTDRGITQKEFALRLDMTEKHISRLINGEVQLTPNVALRLESVLGVPAKFWSNLEANYREQLARVQDELAFERDEETAQKMPYTKIASLGWVPVAPQIADKVRNLRIFFEVACLGRLIDLQIPGMSCRKVGNSESSDYILACWAQQARRESRKVGVTAINMERLHQAIPEMRLLTVQSPELFCARLREILASCGIALVFLPHIGGSFLHGASFVDGKRLVIGLTVRGKYADKFWFSLFHELGHIIEGHIYNTGGNDDDDSAMERAADAFARETLIPEKDFQDFIAAGDKSRNAIVNFASKLGIAPGLVLGRLQKDGCVPYNRYAELKQKYELRPA